MVALADNVSDLMYGVAGWMLVGIGLLSMLGAWSALSGGSALSALIMLGFALAFVASGVFVNPRFRRRLDRRHALTRFGRVRSVDHRVFRPEEGTRENCVACGESTEKGLVRRYREEYAVFGLPVWTSEEGYNHYCVDCALAEFPGLGGSGGLGAETVAAIEETVERDGEGSTVGDGASATEEDPGVEHN